MKVGIYIHGLNGTSYSSKANEIEKHFDFMLPGMSHTDNNFISDVARIEYLIGESMRTVPDAHHTIVGSSLGGYIANVIATKHNIDAVLINPMVDVEDMNQFVESNNFDQTNVDFLKTFVPDELANIGRVVLLSKDDDVFDYRKARDLFENTSDVRCFATGGHRFDMNNFTVGELDALNV